MNESTFRGGLCLSVIVATLAACGGGFAPATPPPLGISTATIAGGTAGVGYSAALAASGGTGADSWTVNSGTLPAGLGLSSAGVLSGTPTAVGITTFTIAVNDSGTPQQTATQTYNLTVAASGTATQLSLATRRGGNTRGSDFPADLPPSDSPAPRAPSSGIPKSPRW